MQYAYEAQFSWQTEDEGWLVEFPQFEGAVAFGHTALEASMNAAKVLRLFIAEWLDKGKALPEPMFHNPPCSVVCVDVDDAYRLRSQCITITEAAEELEVSTGRVSQLVTKGILDAIELDGRRYVKIASLNEWKKNRRGAGRPKQTA